MANDICLNADWFFLNVGSTFHCVVPSDDFVNGNVALCGVKPDFKHGGKWCGKNETLPEKYPTYCKRCVKLLREEAERMYGRDARKKKAQPNGLQAAYNKAYPTPCPTCWVDGGVPCLDLQGRVLARTHILRQPMQDGLPVVPELSLEKEISTADMISRQLTQAEALIGCMLAAMQNHDLDNARLRDEYRCRFNFDAEIAQANEFLWAPMPHTKPVAK